MTVTEKQISIPRTIKAFLERAEKMALEKKESEKRRLEQETKRAKTVKQRKEKKERQLLADLMSKYGKE